jgi:hypothetical protein
MHESQENSKHPFGAIVEGWPRYWRISRGWRAIAWPLPGPATQRMSVEGWGNHYFDPRDAETGAVFFKESQGYWRLVREGDIFGEGPFAGLPAH